MSLAERLETLQPVEDPHCDVYEVARDDLVATVRRMKDELGIDMLIDLTAVEYEEDFCGVYHLMTMDDFKLIRLIVHFAKDDMHLPTLSDVFPAANEMEREVYDLFGIIYDGHPNLTRILCPDDFVGHPLRKDYVSNTRD